MPKGGIVPPPVQVRTSFRRRPGAHGDRTQADGALGRLPPSGLGQFRSREPRPVSGAEDFSYVLEAVPGAFLFVGATPPGADPATAPYNHSAHARFDDAALPLSAAVLAALALDRLAEG